ncbi:MAG: copper transporter [Coriobacteriia bacterium]|nr:copper transporter [Coriobacteriia bacterium]
MYSFRYHLVTICSILMALALGLLLGAAIASSELAQRTQSDMVDSMLSRYESLVDANDKLEEDILTSTAFATTLSENWTEGRLNGRTIVLMFGNSRSDEILSSDLAAYLTRAGASVVHVTVLLEDFGLGDRDISSALRELIEEDLREDHQQALAKRLAEEWSYQNNLPLPESSREDHNLAPYTYSQPINFLEASPLDLDGGLEPQTPLQKRLFEQYPLTRALLSLGVISISVNYSNLQELEDPAPPKEQLAALHIATAWQLPYCVNGFINGYLDTDNLASDDASAEIQMGTQLALSMHEAAKEGLLQFATWYRVSFARGAEQVLDEQANYHVLLVQPASQDYPMEQLANFYGFSCVTTPETPSGRYSIVALLTGAEAGIYGEDRSLQNRFAPLPLDVTGRAAFKDNSFAKPDSAAAAGTSDQEATKEDKEEDEPSG